MFKKTSILISLIGLLLNKHMVKCNAIPEPASNDPIQSFPTGGGPFGGNNVVSQFGPSQNPPTGFGANARPTYFGSSSMPPFPTLGNSQPPLQHPQQFGGQVPSYPYVALYGGNNAGSLPQMLPYYSQFRPYQGGQAPSGIGAFGSASITPFSSRFQTNLQFGQQPPLFDRMDTAKQTDEQEKKQPTQQ